MQNLIKTILELCDDLNDHVHKMATYGLEEANAEHDYRIERMQQTLKEQEKGTPATLIKAIVDGKTADTRFKRDKARVFYKTAQEKINATKKQIDTYNDEVKREWNNNE